MADGQLENAGYWASLRAATPLATDDGLNFLRLGRSAPFGIQYFEVGNEVYGSWETDEHAARTTRPPMSCLPSSSNTCRLAHQSISYRHRRRRADDSYNQLVHDVLQQSAAQGFTIGSSATTITCTRRATKTTPPCSFRHVSDPNSPYDWAVRAAGYTELINNTWARRPRVSSCHRI